MLRRACRRRVRRNCAPELFLYTVLDEHMLYEDMRTVVKVMMEKAPNSPQVRDLAAWVAGR